MFKAVSVLFVVLALYVEIAPAAYCETTLGVGYYCSFSCCRSITQCCIYSGSYWYAWTLISLFFLVCLCACVGCGGYGYRRRYYVRHQPAATVVTTAQSTAYQSQSTFPQSQAAYQPYAPPKDVPPPYNPNVDKVNGDKPPAYY